MSEQESRVTQYMLARQREDIAHRAYLEEQAEKREIAELLASNPEIGVLNSGVYYAHIDGYDQPPFESRDVREVAARLAEMRHATAEDGAPDNEPPGSRFA